MELSSENGKHSYLKVAGVLISVEKEAGVDLIWSRGQYFEGSLQSSRPWGIIAETAKSWEADFFSCNHTEMFQRY